MVDFFTILYEESALFKLNNVLKLFPEFLTHESILMFTLNRVATADRSKLK